MPAWSKPELRDAFGDQLGDRDQAIEAGAVHVGWKLGFCSKGAMEALQIEGPLVGFLCQGQQIPNHSSVSSSGYQNGKLEIEVAVHVGKDLAADASVEEAEAAIRGLGMAVELVDLDVPLDDGAALLRSNVCHRGYVLAAPTLGVRHVQIDVSMNGEPVATGADPEAAVGDFAELLQHVASVLGGDAGPGLRAGDVIITGAAIPPLDLDRGWHYQASAANLEPVDIRT
ncbi:MAG: fumarylacetoacetate hydrolase family protein [Solirubrobacteraceae bacterium]